MSEITTTDLLTIIGDQQVQLRLAESELQRLRERIAELERAPAAAAPEASARAQHLTHE